MYSRRDFGKMVLAAAPVSAALAKINSKVGGVQLGVQTYSFRDFPHDGAMDAVIKAMTDIGLGECELYSSPLEPAGIGGGPRGKQNDPARQKAREDLRKWRLSPAAIEQCKTVHKKFDDAGITIHSFNYSFKDDFTNEEIDRGFDMAKALGAKVITASTTLPVAQRVAPFAEKHKLVVAMHGHSNLTDPNEFAKPESFAKALAMSKYFKINLDIGHFWAAGYDPVEFIRSHHEQITNLHIKDRKKNQGDNVPWGQGDTPIKAVLVLLKEKKYPIPAMIEYEYKGTGSPTEEVRKCFQFCKAALA